MTDQTPSTEDVRVLAALNAYYNVLHYGDTRAIAALDDYHPNNVEAMRAAVRAARNPAHDREVAAKALREAAEDIRTTWPRVELSGIGSVVFGSPASIAKHLTDRASRIGAGILVGTLVSIEHVDDIPDCEACVRIVADTAEGRRSAMLWQTDAVTITGADG